MKQRFDFMRLEGYQLAAEFVLWTQAQARNLRRRRTLAEQLDRAAVSIALNIAEAAGEYLPKEKAHFYRIARRSATECAAAVDLLARGGAVPEEDADRGADLLSHVVPLLVTMCLTQERKARTRAVPDGRRSWRSAATPD